MMCPSACKFRCVKRAHISTKEPYPSAKEPYEIGPTKLAIMYPSASKFDYVKRALFSRKRARSLQIYRNWPWCALHLRIHCVWKRQKSPTFPQKSPISAQNSLISSNICKLALTCPSACKSRRDKRALFLHQKALSIHKWDLSLRKRARSLQMYTEIAISSNVYRSWP